MINIDSIDILKLKEQFKNHNRIVINNFLLNDHAESFYEFYNEKMPSNWWHASSYPSFTKGESHEFIPVTDENYHTIQINKSYSNKCLNDNVYSYFFYRTLTHNEGCNCTHCSINDFLCTPKMVNILNEITDLKLEKPTTIFANKYTSDCFLATHTDDGNGRLAFVLHLTKDWNPCWGGLYMDHTDPYNIKTLLPSFNKMVMFKVGNNQTPHSVSCVTNNLTRKRISVTGWYN